MPLNYILSLYILIFIHIIDVSHSDAVTIRQSDETTALYMITPNQTASKPPSPHIQQAAAHTAKSSPPHHTTTSPPMHDMTADDATLLASPPLAGGNNTTIAFRTQHYNEASTMQVGDSTLFTSKLSPSTAAKPDAAATVNPPQAVIEAPTSMFVPGVHCTMTHINADIPITNLTKRYVVISCFM